MVAVAKTQRHWRESHAWLSGRDAALIGKPKVVPEWWSGQFEQDWLRGYEKGAAELALHDGDFARAHRAGGVALPPEAE